MFVVHLCTGRKVQYHTAPCLSTYIYIYISMYVCMHVCIRTCVHAYVYTYIRTYIHTYIHTCMHAYMHTGRQTASRTDGRTDRQVCVCVCGCIFHTYTCAQCFSYSESLQPNSSPRGQQRPFTALEVLSSLLQQVPGAPGYWSFEEGSFE